MIEKGKIVKIHYSLIVDNQVVDESRADEPMEYEHGSGQIIPGLERALEGLRSGDCREVCIGPDDAYGVIDPNAIVSLPKTQLPEGNIQPGTVLRGKDPQGRPIQGIVRELRDKTVTVDFNHPLAGKELHFKIEIVDVR